MNILEKFMNNKNIILFLILCFIISTSIRFFIFPDFGLLQNDDYLYHKISNNIMSGNGITSDGINPHIHFPPGYPFILGLESLIIKDPMLRRCLEWAILTSIVSLFTFLICNLIGIKRKYLASLICFFTPVYIYGTYTLSISSETWFSVIGSLGLVFSIKYVNNKKISNLFFANTLFCISYLIRPEGILFYASTISILTIDIIGFRVKGGLKKEFLSKKFLKNFLSFSIPFFIFVFPYLIYLHSNLGRWTLSGKDNAHEILKANISTTFTEKLIGTIDLIFLSPFFLGLSITFLTLLIFLKYIFNKRFKLQSFYGKKFTYFSVLFTPLIPNIYICLKYFPGPRSIYGFIPCIIPLFFLFLESTDSKVISHKRNLLLFKSKFFIKNDFLNILILFILAFNLIIPKYFLTTKAAWINNPKLYNKTIDLFKKDLSTNKKPLVYSRYYNLAVDNQEFDICYDVPNNPILFDYHKKLNCSNRNIDYLILSNLSHQSMTAKAQDWELSAINKDKFNFKKQTCTQISKLYSNNKNFKVVGFKCIN